MAGLYLHIPFCKQRCAYCDFYSTTCLAERDHFVKLLCREIQERSGYLNEEEISTIYIGGGTPSLLNETHIEQLVHTWESCFRIASDAEITLEANPDDLTAAYAEMLLRYTFNRISLGVQSFQDKTLAILNRRHSASQVFKAMDTIRRAGFTNISMDLIYGLPGEKLEQWKENVEKILMLHPEHISAYLLTYEEGTLLAELRKVGQVTEMDEEEALQCYTFLTNRLKKAGYDHYEISNFALPGRYSRHNMNYWKSIPYLGCGPSAHSYNGIGRQWNISDLHKYRKGWEENNPLYEKEELDVSTRYNDYVVTRLRTKWGISLKELTEYFGKEYADFALENASFWISERKLLLEGEFLRLSEEGIFVSDAVMSDFMYV